MIITPKTVKGTKGETVCYTIPNFRFNEGTSTLAWDSFTFYTPAGSLVDSAGYKYFVVEGAEVLIERDSSLNKILLIIVRNTGIEAIECFEGTSTTINVGLEGDIICTGIIPYDPSLEIQVEYKEVKE